MCKLLSFLFQKMFKKAGVLLLLNMMKCHYLRMACLPVALSTGFLILWSLKLVRELFFLIVLSIKSPRVGQVKGWKRQLCWSCSLLCQLISVAHISLLLNLAVAVTAGRSLPIWTEAATALQWLLTPPPEEICILDCMGRGRHGVPILLSLSKPHGVSLDWKPLVYYCETLSMQMGEECQLYLSRWESK